jgi:putative acetyltransferase
MTTGITIEPEIVADREAIRNVVMAAFEGRTEEADLVDALRASGDLLLSLVARSRGEVVGHVAFSRIVVDDPHGLAGAVALAPIGVRPDMQAHGLGARLIERGLEELANAGETVVLVVGNPAYYRRFGFDPEPAKRFESEYSGPHFMARLLVDPSTAPAGPVTYPEAFDVVH